MTEITHEYSLENFNRQIEYAIQNYVPHGLKSSQFSNIIICGLGGSGIGGRIAKAYYADKATLPIDVFSDYSLPRYASKNSLIILSSYSGTTEETLAMFQQAQKLGAKIICISSGGELLSLAKSNNLPLYPIETGYQPRMALGFSLTYNLMILGELFETDTKKELESVLSIYQNNAQYQTLAREILNQFAGRETQKFVIIADNPMEAVGVRFCQQLQENAKSEAFINVLPEANHNAFESYYGKLPTNFIMLNSHSNDRNTGRFAYLKQLLESQGNTVVALDLKNASISELYKTIYITDWISIFLADIKGSDKMSVPNIMGLKNFLKTF